MEQLLCAVKSPTVLGAPPFAPENKVQVGSEFKLTFPSEPPKSKYTPLCFLCTTK